LAIEIKYYIVLNFDVELTASVKDIIIDRKIVKNNDTLSGQKLYWLGIFFMFLAASVFAFSFISNWLSRKTPPRDLTQITIPPYNPDSEDDHGEGAKKSLLERLNFKKAHENFQQSYLDLVKNISESSGQKIDIRKQRDIFNNYSRAQNNYKNILGKVEEYEKDFRLKCFARMRSIILAVLFYDRQAKTRMTRFNAEELIKIGALKEIPVCPRGGKYSIVYKDGRRLFNCSIHGTLKN